MAHSSHLEPLRRVAAFAPGTLANLGPGFDCLGLALAEPGDRVEVRWADDPGVRVESIEGDGARLPRDPDLNTAAVAAREVLALLGCADRGVTLRLTKGLPLGSGLGSSGASAVAAAVAVHELAGAPLPLERLLLACMTAEAAASGTAHADNVAPALLGGIVLVRPGDPPEAIRLPVPRDLFCAVVHPDLVIHTREARAALPVAVPRGDAVHQAAHLAAFVAALYSDDLELLGRAVVDRIAEPARAPLIRGHQSVVAAAREAGALACSISGSGPSLFAFAKGETAARSVAEAMRIAFGRLGIGALAWAARVDPRGARIVP